MVLDWITGRHAKGQAVAAVHERIPPALWADTLASYPFLAALDDEERAALKQRAAWLLALKTWNGAQGVALDDAIQLAIAAQAALPVLHLPPDLYAGWEEIIVYPGGFMIEREHVDEAGIVHTYTESASGEAWDAGPLILSWEDALAQTGGYNVVIHEFAHKLDLSTGFADGVPDLSGHGTIDPRHWRRVLDQSLDILRAALDAIEASIPPDVDPESEQADYWYDQLPLDPYAATDEAEFFAVSSEHFFADPQPMATLLPQWYDLLVAYYRQDPLARLARAQGIERP
ncbi:MAG: hypothetical protein EOO27_09450 [Comamonadaceae bacterium]|nr:MAG: hypothetical protein EOO27_09450 [Comamonadaceae bacterium]